jgi:hypothetical protein
MAIDRRGLILGGAALLVAGTSLPATAADYVVLGSRTVNLGSDHDRIYVGPLRGIFSRIRLEVSGNAIFMQDLKVTFMNGETADLPVRLLIEEGGRTRDILLPGLLRLIAHIDMRYVRVPLGGRAKVTIVGKRL